MINLFLVFASLVSCSVFAVSPKVQKIFDRKPASTPAASSPQAKKDFEYQGELPDAEERTDYYQQLREKKRSRGVPAFDGERVFGIGFRGAGAYGIFGAEFELGIDENLGFGLGIGTGMSYSAWASHLRYYFKSKGRVNTFFQAGYANWFLGKVPDDVLEIRPFYLGERFFETDGALAIKRVHIMYPAVGVLFQHESGLAAELLLQYLINLSGGLNGALYGGFGWSYYF